MTIGELAERVRMTPRNIREWQTIGVLPPPQRRGRIGLYDDTHLTRIQRVKELRADGFPLEVIRKFIDRTGASADDFITTATTLLDPAGRSAGRTVPRAELAQLGATAEASLLKCGVITPISESEALVTDEAMFECIRQLTQIGLPIGAITTALEAMTQHHVAAVSVFAEMYSATIWQPFVDDGFPPAQWHSIAMSSRAMRDALIGLGERSLRQATDIAIGRIAMQQAAELNS